MVAPMSPVLFPMPKQVEMMIAAAVSIGATGGAAETITIPNDYPEIDISLPNPVIAIAILQADATLLASGAEFLSIADHCDGAPDSAKEFQITGVRTIDFYQTPNELQCCLVFYIPRGSGIKT